MTWTGLVHNMSNPSIHAVKKTRNEYRAVDGNNHRWFIEGTLQSNGNLAFQVVREDSSDRSSIRGHEFFDAMMEHFGDQVKVIEGHWTDTPGFDTNLKIFNEKTLAGDSKQEAAFATKTGTWAKKRGYKKLKRVDTIPDNFPGGYEQVLVEFEK